MPRIIKSNSVKLDLEHKVNIVVPAVQIKSIVEDIPLPPDVFLDEPEDVSDAEKAEHVVEAAKKEADKIIKKAQKEADKLLADMKTQGETHCQMIMEASQKEGYQKGYEAGLGEVAHLKQEAVFIVENAKKEREQTLHDVEPEVVKLIIGICEKILSDSVRLSPQIVVNLVKQGLNQSTITGNVYVRVSQEDYEGVLENRDKILSMQDSKTQIEIVKDMNLTKGDCVIETPFGNVDCSLGLQFSGLRQDLCFLLYGR